VADILRRQVLQGAFPDGLLPSEASLAQAFGASRNAIRDAFGILRAEGLLVRVQGGP
jgi:GntR family transcriptional regulator